MGIWEAVERNAMGYNDAAAAFGNRQLDAFWLFTAFPSGAVIMAAQTNDIALVDLAADAEATGFFERYPYFSELAVPAGTYRGVDHATPSFQDSALWVRPCGRPGRRGLRPALQDLRRRRARVHASSRRRPSGRCASEHGLKGIVTPLHPGAERFWSEHGLP